jgi:O-antigen ligase
MRRPGAPAERVALIPIRLGAGFIGVALVFSLWASPDRTASLPWFAIAMAGVLLVLVITGPLRAAASRKIRAGHLLWFFLAVGFTTLIVTLFASRWPVYKLSWLNDVYGALPSIRSLPLWWTQQGLQPNQTGGMLALCTAFAVAVATDGGVKARHRWPAAFLTVAGFVAVFMTGSRAALAGLAVAVLLVLIVRTSRWLWAWGAGFVVVVVGLFTSGQLPRLIDFFVHDETLDTKLVARLDIWTSALGGIQDHLFTGIGLGVFNQVMPVRYPYQTVGLSYPVSQAHNLLLDTALAIGIPGALGLVLLMALRGVRQAHLTRVVSLGVLASMVVSLTFGITDSISFSIPTSFIIWLWICALTVLRIPLARDSMNVLEYNP